MEFKESKAERNQMNCLQRQKQCSVLWSMAAKIGVKMALLKVTVAGIGKLQILCSNHVGDIYQGGVYSADSAWKHDCVMCI